MALQGRKLAIIQTVLGLSDDSLLHQVEELLADAPISEDTHPEKLSTTDLQAQLDTAADNLKHDKVCSTKAVWELFNPPK